MVSNYWVPTENWIADYALNHWSWKYLCPLLLSCSFYYFVAKATVEDSLTHSVYPVPYCLFENVLVPVMFWFCVVWNEFIKVTIPYFFTNHINSVIILYPRRNKYSTRQIDILQYWYFWLYLILTEIWIASLGLCWPGYDLALT